MLGKIWPLKIRSALLIVRNEFFSLETTLTKKTASYFCSLDLKDIAKLSDNLCLAGSENNYFMFNCFRVQVDVKYNFHTNFNT